MHANSGFDSDQSVPPINTGDTTNCGNPSVAAKEFRNLNGHAIGGFDAISDSNATAVIGAEKYAGKFMFGDLDRPYAPEVP
jgi:hypothetical protein